MACWPRSVARACAVLAIGALAATGCKRDDSAKSLPNDVKPEDAAAAVAEADDLSDGAKDAPEAESTITSPFLWEVQAADGGGEGYLFGTFHMGVDAEATLPDVVWERFDDADTFAMETDLTDMSIAGKLMRDDGTSLRDEIGDEAWEVLVSNVGGMRAGGLDQMWAASAATALMATMLPTTPPMDLVLHQRAIEADLAVVYLEDVEHQVDLLLRYITADVLVAMLEDLDEVEEMIDKGLAAYLDGDAELLTEFLLDPGGWEQSPEGAQEAFLDERNEAWMPTIEELIAQGTPFVAVGAGHLVGDGSVVDLLRERGYDVRRLSGE